MKRPLLITLIVLLVVALAAVLGLLFGRQGSSGSGSNGSTDSNDSNDSIGSTATSSFPLKEGDRGELVSELQMRLNDQLGLIGEPLLDVDGIFGPRTLAAVQHLLLTDTVTRQQFDQLLVAW